MSTQQSRSSGDESPGWEVVTCAKCSETGQCTPWSDYYTSPLWDGNGRVCESCFRGLVREHLRQEAHGG